MDNQIRRRDFFKVLGASGAVAATAAACADPPEKLIPYLLPPTNIEYVPGNPLEYATTCMECSAGCGMVIRTREARAIKAEGNPDHPLNQGALCIRGQASLQTHYNPARFAGAVTRNGDKFEAVEWAAAEKLFIDKLKAVTDKRQVVYITGNAAGTRAKFLDAWLAAIGASPKIVLEPLSLHNVKAANDRSFKRPEVPVYRIGDANLLLNFGSEFLETWLNPVANAREFTAMHAVDDATKRKGKFIHVGPHVSLTGANADEWVPAKPGSEGILALALARIVLEKGKGKVPAGEAERIASYLKPYTVEKAQESTGIKAETIKRLGEEFAATRSLALAGGNLLASESGTAVQGAVNLLNYVAGNIGTTVQFGGATQFDLSMPFNKAMEAVQRMAAGQVKLLIVDGANPIYSFPPGSKVAEAIAKVDFVVSLSSATDETTKMAHLVLPGQTFLERWGDAFPQRGVYSLVQPVMAPVYPVKAAEDTLLSVAQGLGVGAFKATPTYRDYLRQAWVQVQHETGSSGDFDSFWRASLQRGGVFQKVSFAGGVRLSMDSSLGPVAEPKLAGEGLVLLPTASLRHGDGRGASNPWLQEIPDPISDVVWDSWADLNPVTAKKMGIAHGDLIRLTSSQGAVETAAYLHYGVHEDAIAIPMGQGHSGSGRDADLRGVNVMSLLPPAFDKVSGEFAYLSTRVKVEKLGKQAYLVQTDGSPRQLGREIVQTIALKDLVAEKPPKPLEDNPHTFYQSQDKTHPGYHEPYRWGMTVDVDRCTGCSACVAACYAENNIAVAGKERINLGREMSWLRIERYIEGEGDNFRMLLQPMMCQQCGNAGCEPVCPVYATFHNPDGLNAQVYNRCVGTRYCSNNCGYKVRRFNWFNYEFPAPLHLQLNPDVTVRSKGVMEKCTFCVQRIQRAKMAAHTEGRELQDGEVVTACMQTCPTKALTFGNLADPNSAVSKKALRNVEPAKRVRQYEVLEELRNLPAVTYLRKVTLTETEEA
jgi:anaerobic selenocysteine-containing dehydrogenase/Fe-S-cluster-containing dehydrogenase component